MTSRLYWLLALLGVVVIGSGSALYYQRAKQSATPATKTEVVPATETATTETPAATSTDNKAAVKTGIDASDATIGDLADDISDIDEDTGSSNKDDEKPNF